MVQERGSAGVGGSARLVQRSCSATIPHSVCVEGSYCGLVLTLPGPRQIFSSRSVLLHVLFMDGTSISQQQLRWQRGAKSEMHTFRKILEKERWK